MWSFTHRTSNHAAIAQIPVKGRHSMMLTKHFFYATAKVNLHAGAERHGAQPEVEEQ